MCWGPSKRAWRHSSTSCPSWRALAGLPVLRTLKSGCEPQATTTQRTSCLKAPREDGWGEHVNEILQLTGEEQVRIAWAFAQTFFCRSSGSLT